MIWVQAEAAAAQEAKQAAVVRASAVEEQMASVQQVGIEAHPLDHQPDSSHEGWISIAVMLV